MRAFIAVEVPKEIAERIAVLQSELPADSIKPVPAEKMHLTLKFLENISEQDAIAIKKIIAEIQPAPFAVSCAGVGVFPTPNYVRVVWTGADSDGKLESIANTLDSRLQEIGIKKDEPGFSSHITVARVRKKVNLSDFLSRHKDDVFGEFVAREIKLKKSKITPSGPIYSDL